AFIQAGFTNTPNHRAFHNMIGQQLTRQPFNIRSLERCTLNQVTPRGRNMQTVDDSQFPRRRRHPFAGPVRLSLGRMNINLPKHHGPVSFLPPLPESKANSRYRLVPKTPEDFRPSDPTCRARRARAADWP